MSKIVAFGHISRVGKDSSAKFLDTELRVAGRSVKKLSFAKKLKDVTYNLFRIYGAKPAIHYENHPEDRKIILPEVNKTIVELWIEVGNKLREVYAPVWIDNCLESFTDVDFIIITDLRFPNEAKAVKKRNGLCVRVDRPDFEPISNSDRQLLGYDGWDIIIKNDQELKGLHDQIVELARKLV